jgi:hypothetical protein
MRLGRRPSASCCGTPLGFAEESKMPGRHFRESQRRSRAQSKFSSQKQRSQVKGEAQFMLTNLEIAFMIYFPNLKSGKASETDRQSAGSLSAFRRFAEWISFSENIYFEDLY